MTEILQIIIKFQDEIKKASFFDNETTDDTRED